MIVWATFYGFYITKESSNMDNNAYRQKYKNSIILKTDAVYGDEINE